MKQGESAHSMTMTRFLAHRTSGMTNVVLSSVLKSLTHRAALASSWPAHWR